MLARRGVLLALVCFLATVGSRGEAALIGISWNPFDPSSGTLFQVDPDSGQLTSLGLTGLPSPRSLGSLPDGSLVATQDQRLVMIDPLDGSTSGFLDLTLSSGANLAASGLAYSATDGLLLLNSETRSGVGSGSYLYQIDLASGVAARVGPASIGIAAGLTFGPTGLLYSWHRDLGLVTIDSATSRSTQVGVGPGGDFMQHLAALPDGSLMGVAQVSPGLGGPRNLFRISAVDGSQQLVATLGPAGEFFALGGLAYAVPEPSGGVLVALLVLLARAVRSAAPRRVR